MDYVLMIWEDAFEMHQNVVRQLDTVGLEKS